MLGPAIETRVEEWKRRVAATRAAVARHRVALHAGLLRGHWSSRLSGAAMAGTALLAVLPLLDPGATSGTPIGAAKAVTHPAAPSPSTKPSTSLAASLLDDSPSTRTLQPADAASATQPAPQPPWRIVPTRRLDLGGQVVDSIDPIRVAAKSDDKSKSDGKSADKSKANTAKEPGKKDSGSKPAADDKPLPVPPSTAPTEQQADAWTDAEVAEARAECARLITGVNLDGDEAAPVRNGACGAPAPITLKRAGGAMTELHPPALVNCRMAVALNTWIDDTLQPAAKSAFGQPVARILTASSYVCRNRYGQDKAPISEHAFANALDISGFVLGNGRVVKIIDGWGPTARDAAAKEAEAKAAKAGAPSADKAATSTDDKSGKAAPDKDAKAATDTPKPPKKPKAGAALAAEPAPDKGGTTEATFLRRLHKGACGPFGTVLGPEANEAHRDHLHIDLKQRKHVAICE